MQTHEDPVNFVRRVFSLVFEGDSLSKAVRVRDFFSVDFVLDTDGRSLNRSDFEAYLLAQRCGCTGHIRHVDVHFIPASCM